MVGGASSPAAASIGSTIASGSRDKQADAGEPSDVSVASATLGVGGSPRDSSSQEQCHTPAQSLPDSEDKSPEVLGALDWLFGKKGLGEENGAELARWPGAEEELEKLGIRARIDERIRGGQARARGEEAVGDRSPASDGEGGREEVVSPLQVGNEEDAGSPVQGEDKEEEEEEEEVQVQEVEQEEGHVQPRVTFAECVTAGEEAGRDEGSRRSGSDTESEDNAGCDFEDDCVVVSPPGGDEGGGGLIGLVRPADEHTREDGEEGGGLAVDGEGAKGQDDMNSDDEPLPSPPKQSSFLSYAVGAVGAAALAVGMYRGARGADQELPPATNTATEAHAVQGGGEGGGGAAGQPALRRQTTSQWAMALAAGSRTVAAVALRSVYRMYCVNRFGGRERTSPILRGSRSNSASGAAMALAAGTVMRKMMGAAGRGGADELHLDSLCAGLASVIYNSEARAEFRSLGFEVTRIEEQDARKLHPKWAVLRHQQLGLAVVVFRGTYSCQDVVADVSFRPVALPCGVAVNSGVHGATVLSAEGIKAALREALRDGTRYRLVICGHSYGGACAQILRLLTLTGAGWGSVLSRVTCVEVVTFGAPLAFGKHNDDGTSAEVVGDAGDAHRAGQGHAPAHGGAYVRTQGLSGGAPSVPPAQPTSPLGIMAALAAGSRHYVHQCDVVPRLLGPRSAELLTKMMEGMEGMERGGHVAELVGRYAPVGSFRVVYTEGGRRRERHIVREVADAEGIQALLEPAPLIYLPHALLDHDSTFYRDKLNAACSEGASVGGASQGGAGLSV